MWKKFKIAIVILFLSFLLLSIWGVLIEPRMLDVQNHDIQIPNLSPSWNGSKIAFISDLQIGMWLGNVQAVEKAVKRVVQEKPVVLLIGGDFIYHPLEQEEGEIEEVMEEFEREEYIAESREEIVYVTKLLRPVPQSGIRTLAVLGNHDYGIETPYAVKMDWVAKELTASLEKIQIRVLQNDSIRITNRNGDALHIVGIGSYYAEEDDVEKATSGLTASDPRIIFMHNPQSFEKIAENTAPLAVAAHTHGGQIRIPFMPDWTWLEIVKEREIHADGWIKNFGKRGNRLYVNRGIGFSYVPVRLNCRPELTLFRLKS